MADVEFFSGNTGRTYQYIKCYVNRAWKWQAGNYILARMGLLGPVPIYIGETSNLALRMPDHERLREAEQLGAELIFAHVNDAGEDARKAEEKDLIRAYNPPLNVQHRPVRGMLSNFPALPSPTLAELLANSRPSPFTNGMLRGLLNEPNPLTSAIPPFPRR